MRDRRNTSLLASPRSSNDSTTSSPSRSSLNGKRLSSPPPLSPSLPTPVTKENYSRPNGRARLRMAMRLFAITCAAIALWHLLFKPLRPFIIRVPGSYGAQTERKFVSDGALLMEPAVVIVSEQSDHSKWTVSIPHEYSFPLANQHYEDICRQSTVLRDRIAQETQLLRAKDWRRKHSYYSVDPSFLEPNQAELTGALPRTKDMPTGIVCEKSVTFVLGDEDASFGKSLLMLWLTYGLAKKEGRAFFIDDTRWAFGRYASFFVPPPSLGCVQPPRHHIVPCPHSAKHLVVSTGTVPWTFGSSFEKEFSQARKQGAEKSQLIFDLLRIGYDDLFVMIGEDALYASSRLARFKEEAHQHGGPVVGMHIRRGDLHPLEFQYSQDYLPLERYTTAIRRLLRSQLGSSIAETHTDANGFHKVLKNVHSPLLLGSDDPEMFDSIELKDAASPFVIQKAQQRIQLATKATLDLASPAEGIREPGSAYVKHVEENSGWEGGFYSSLFFGLGRPRYASTNRDNKTVTADTLRMRELIARAYLLDLAVLGESDGVACAVSSASCRVLGVMMGWDTIKEGRWVNVDDGRPWSWNGNP